MKQQYETFVEAMAEHGDPIKAYLKAYPNAKESSARSAAYRLLQHPEVSKAVTFDAKHLHKKAKAQAIKKGTKRVVQQLADIQKRREVLAQMIFGTAKRKRFFKLDGEIIWVEDDIPSQSVLRAIELDCKLEAGFDWTGRRTSSAKQEKQEPAKAGPDNPIEPKPEELTGVIILCGDTLFESNDAEWIERYIAWKKANPARVREWAVDNPVRNDYYIEWPEDAEGLPGSGRNFNRKGSYSLIHIIRYPNGLPGGPFIPGQSRYFTSYEDQHAFYGTKPFNARDLSTAVHPAEGGIPNSSVELSASNLVSEANNSGAHVAEGKIGGCLHNTDQATPSNIQHPASSIPHPAPNQQNATIPLTSNPPQPANMPENRKVYHNSDELWEAYKAALPAWPHLSEKTRRFTEQDFRGRSMSQQRMLLRHKQGCSNDKNSAA